MNVSDPADLGKLRRYAARLAHDDERLLHRVVSLLRNSSTVARIICASDDLAFDALRLVAGLRFKRESAAAWVASEFALAA
jgi:hypothetical protein